MNVRQKINLFFLVAILTMVVACSSATPTPATIAGFWLDDSGNVTTIKYQNGQYVPTSNYYMLAARSQNQLVSSSNENGVLTWEYCQTAKPCITLQMVAFNGDTIDVNWTKATGESGQMTLTRTDKGDPWQN